MIKTLQGRIIFFLLFLILTQSCLDPNETQGKCTKCLSTQNLESGNCYTKLRGCLKQSANTCIQCQEGYIFGTNNLCVKQAEFYNNTNLAPAPIKIQDSKLASSQIQPVLVGGYQETTDFNSKLYLSAQAALYNEYPFLGGYKMYKVEEQIVNGQNFIFYIINQDNYDLYLAKIYVSLQLQATINQIYKNDVSILKESLPVQGPQPLPGVWRSFTNITDQRYIDSLNLIQKAIVNIDTYKLVKVQYQVVAGINFLFYYTGPKGQSFTVQVYKPFYGSGVAKNSWGVKPPVSSTEQLQPSPFAGGSQIMPASEYNSQPFLSVVKVIQKVFPDFTTSQIKNVQRQIVAGWNLIVSFTLPNSSDVFQLQVFVPLSYTGNPPQIQSMKKNGVAYTVTSSTSNNSQQTTSSNNNEVPKQTTLVKLITGGYENVTNLISPFYVQAKQSLFKDYPQLATLALVKAQQQLVNGVNYIFYFINQQTNDVYLSEIYVDFKLNVEIKSVFKNSQSIKIGYQKPTQFTEPQQGEWAQFNDQEDQRYVSAQNLVFDNYPGLSLSYRLDKVQSQVAAGINFRFFFVDDETKQKFTVQAFVSFIGKTQINNVWGTVPQVKSITSPQITTPVAPIQAGGRQKMDISQLNTEPYSDAITAVQKIFPDFTNSLITKLEKQVVAGWNIYITFSYQSDIYELVVFIPLPNTGQVASVSSILKNGQTYDPSSPSTQVIQTQSSLLGGYTKLTDYNDDLFKIANQTLFTQYPQLSKFTIKNINQQLVNGVNYMFTIVDPKTGDQYESRVYVTFSKQASVEQITKNNVKYTKSSTSTPTQVSNANNNSTVNNLSSSIDQLIAGGWQQVTLLEYKYEPFLSVQSTLIKSFPTFVSSLIKKAAKQVVAGWNYVIQFTLPQSSDLYEVKVFVPLSYTGQPPSITSVTKNGLTYDPTASKISPPYSYQSDPNFAELYKFFKSQVNISNLLPIVEVSRQLKTLPLSLIKYYEYKITYSSEEYAICRYYQDYGVYEVISYIADKTELYHLADKLKGSLNDRSENVLVQKIKSYDTKKFNRVLIKDITQIKLSQYYRVYKINAYTYSGHYMISILDKGELFVIQALLVDNQRCFSIKTNTTVQYRQQYIIDQVKTFLFSKYSLSGFQLTLAVVNVFDNFTNQYVLLLSRDDFKKLKVSVQETVGTFAIKKQQLLNGGLYVVSDLVLQQSIEKSARTKYQQLTGFERVIVLMNGTFVLGRFANDTTISTYILNNETKSEQLRSKQFSKSNSCQTYKLGTSNVCLTCSKSDILWKGKCYSKITNCASQVASQCIACDKYSIQLKGKCVRDCSDIFAS